MHILFGVLYCGTKRRILNPQVTPHLAAGNARQPGQAFNGPWCADAIRSMLASVGLTIQDIRGIMADRASYHCPAVTALLDEESLKACDRDPDANDGDEFQIVPIDRPAGILEGAFKDSPRDFDKIFLGCLAHAINNAVVHTYQSTTEHSPWLNRFSNASEALRLFYQGFYQSETRKLQFESFRRGQKEADKESTELDKIARDILELKDATDDGTLKSAKLLYPVYLHSASSPQEAIELLKKLHADTVAKIASGDTRPLQQNETRYNISLYASFLQMYTITDHIMEFCVELKLAPTKSLYKLGQLLTNNSKVVRAELSDYLLVMKPVINFLDFLGDRNVSDKPIAHKVYKHYKAMRNALEMLGPPQKELGRYLLREIDHYLRKPALRWNWWKALRLLDPYQLTTDVLLFGVSALYPEFKLLELGVSADDFDAYCTATTREREHLAPVFWEMAIDAKRFEPWNTEALSLLYVPPSVLEVDGIISVANYLSDPRCHRLTPAHFAERVMTHIIAQSEPVLS